MDVAVKISNLAILRASWRKRLWLAAGGIGVFIATVWGAGALVANPVQHGSGFGLDFIAFYTAGSFVHQGRLGDLYNLDAVHQFQRELSFANHFDIGRAYGPWWNPPFYALLFAPLARLPYVHASAVWIGINLLCFAAACILLRKLFPETAHWKTWTLIPVLTVLSAPFILAISHAQNTCTSLLLLMGAVTFWRSRRPLLAGLIGGLLFYKPQVAAVLALVLIIDLGWRAVLGYAITGLVLLATNLVVLPGTLTDYLRRLPVNVHAFQTGTHYPWEQHVTIKAFWRLLLQGQSLGDAAPAVTILSIASAAGLAILLIRAAIRLRIAHDSTPPTLLRDRLIAATIVATPLLMPFYFDYDLLLLVVPAVLLASEYMQRASDARPSPDRRLLATWAALYAGQMINAEFAGKFHVNVSVVLLALLFLMLIARVHRVELADASALRSPDSDLLRAA